MKRTISQVLTVLCRIEKVQDEMMMKRIKLFIREPSINKVIGGELNLLIDDEANLIDTIIEVDKIINNRGGFPVLDY